MLILGKNAILDLSAVIDADIILTLDFNAENVA